MRNGSRTSRPEEAHRRILVIVLALILYGSLYPWQFQDRELGASPLWVLLHSWPGGFNRYMIWDCAVNVTLYLPLGIFGFLAISPVAPLAARLLIPAALGLLLSCSVEMLQLFDDSRVCSGFDVVYNVLGTLLGMALGALYRARLQALVARREAVALLRPTAPLLLVACWVGYQVFPLFPRWGRTALFAKLSAFGSLASISPSEAFAVFAEWLVLACLLEAVFASNSARMFALALFVPFSRLLIASRDLGWTDLAGEAAALTVWLAVPRRALRRAAPLILAAAILVSELAPFHFGPAQRFNWVPFRASFDSTWQAGVVVLFHKSFWYGSLAWLWHQRGIKLPLSAGLVALALFALEWVQIYLPGRTPEITDAALTVLMGVLLWLLDSSDER